MGNELRKHWITFRTKQIRAAWSIEKMLDRLKELGIKVDPTKQFSYAELIARAEAQELRVDDYPPADVTGVPFQEQKLDADFRLTAAGLDEMRAYLEEHFGKTVVDQIAMSVASPNTTYINAEFAEEDDREEGEYISAENDGDDITLTIPLQVVGSKSAGDILEYVLPRVLEYWLRKNGEYGDQHRTGLGPRGEIVGIHRKMYKLVEHYWYGRPMPSEGGKAMLMDLVGQVLIMLDLLGHEAYAGFKEQLPPSAF